MADDKTILTDDHAASFQQHGYTLVRGLTDTAWFYQYALLVKSKGNLRDDRQVPGSLIATSDPIFEKLHTSLLPSIERYTGRKLYETYAFFRLYDIGHELKRYTDRHECEVTVSLCLGYRGDSWPIYIEDKNRREQCFVQQPGDAVIFDGIELPHWRAPNTFGECAYLFRHYVDQNGRYADRRRDGPYWSNYDKNY